METLQTRHHTELVKQACFLDAAAADDDDVLSADSSWLQSHSTHILLVQKRI